MSGKKKRSKKSPGTAPTSEERPIAVSESAPSALPVPHDDDFDDHEDDDEFPIGLGARTLAPHERALAPDADDSPSTPFVTRDEAVEAQIRELEARLDGMIRRSAVEDETPPSIGDQLGAAAREIRERIAEVAEVREPREVRDPDDASPLLSSRFYQRQWGRLAQRERAAEVDDFGLDPAFERRLAPLSDFLYSRWFRAELSGIEHVPNEGRCLIVANHSGTLPLDGAMLRTAVRREHPSGRELRWLAEDFVYYLPFVGTFMNRVGAVRACQENAERLLSQEQLVAVFPEGVKGIGKLYRDRYRLQRFGRGGFIRLCLRTGSPIVPCAVVGAEETNPMLHRVEYLAKAIGVPYVPITPTFPWLGPLGLVPAPTKWRIAFGEPLLFDGYGPEAADDHVLVSRLSDRVRSAIQALLDRGLAQRKSVFLG